MTTATRLIALCGLLQLSLIGCTPEQAEAFKNVVDVAGHTAQVIQQAQGTQMPAQPGTLPGQAPSYPNTYSPNAYPQAPQQNVSGRCLAQVRPGQPPIQCRLQPPLAVGTPCWCPTPYGTVNGYAR